MQGRVFLGRYETIRVLGEGGMGKVYLARQTDLGRQVVVKVMHDHIAADAKFRERFTRETLVMARFQHPYAVTLYDASLNDPQGPCIVMEYIKGITLDVLLQRNGRLTPGRVGRLLYQACEVLQAAHAVGIIHRDLKPANLMVVDPDTPHEMVKVMDFGLAKLLAPEFKQITVTNTEFAVGTPGYMCPEQARGEEMDGRGDLYSLGVIVYELLTGRLPFAGRSTMDVLLAHVTEEPPAFCELSGSVLVPPGVEAVVQSCLAKAPADRPRNARELSERFEAALLEELTPGLPATITPLSPTALTRSPVRPRPTGLIPERGDGADPSSPAPPIPSTEPPDPDSLAVVHYLEAWMPETIATYKLRGFINDVGGEVLESVPGRIRVHLGGKNSVYVPPNRGSFSWLLGRKSQLEMELRLQRSDASRDSKLRITVLFRSRAGDLSNDAAWRNSCAQIFCDLRAYLMGQNDAQGEAAL
jgi:serine/threonine-protein kinase